MKILLIVIIGIIAIIVVHHLQRNLRIISFKELYGVTGVPMVVFNQGDRKYVFLIDTGAEQSVLIKESIDDFVYSPLDHKGILYGIEGDLLETDIVAAKIFCKNQNYIEVFNVHEGQKMVALLGNDEVQITGILGNTFLSRYHCIIDYNHYKIITYGKGIRK